jgi:uroporphyrinogen-III synthase
LNFQKLEFETLKLPSAILFRMPGFNGLRVLSFESRRAQEIAQLIRNNGGEPVVAPSTREVQTPNDDEQELIRGILRHEFDRIIFMTGVGARALVQAAESVCTRNEFLAALGKIQVIVRGPKPAAVMREFSVPVTLSVPEPNTWHEIVKVLDDNPEKVPLKGKRVAVQEHGEPSPELYSALRDRGAEVVPARVYRWELPEDIEPLKQAIRNLTAQAIDVVMFTSSVQYVHALRVAEEMGLGAQFSEALKRTVVASIGPTTSQTLRENGIRVDFEPSHPKMGFLVKEAAEKSGALLHEKSKMGV